MLRKIPLLILVLFFFWGGIAGSEEIRLPTPKYTGKLSLEEALTRRRSERSYYPNQLTNEQISQLLWAAQGITEPQWGFRAAPSAGSCYPLEVYLVNPKGVYNYIPQSHSLKLTLKDDQRPSLARAALGQNFISEAPINIVITAVFERTEEKYGQRAGRYVYMEAGHAAENIALMAVALGLGSVTVGSFWDDVVKSVLDLPAEQEPIYIIPVGYAK